MLEEPEVSSFKKITKSFQELLRCKDPISYYFTTLPWLKDIDQANTLPLPAKNLIKSKVNMNYDFKITICFNLMLAFIWALIYLRKYPTVRHSLLTFLIPKSHLFLLLTIFSHTVIVFTGFLISFPCINFSIHFQEG